jgi:fermentation-respiration switch protein FrsA (DUF1100 family)
VIKRVIAITAAIIGFVLVGSFVVGSALSHPVQSAIGKPPTDLHARDVTFPSESGSTIHGWWCPASPTEAVLLLPGVRANRLSMVDRAKFLHRAGYSVLLIDFQATGESPGRQITFGWRESRDVIAAVSFIRRQTPAARVAVIGTSLGGAAALFATPPLHVEACVLEAVYPTIERAAENRLHNYLGPLGTLGAPLLFGQMQLRIGVGRDQLRPIDHIASINCPVYIINGLIDSRTTREDAVSLYSHARAPKTLWLVAGAGHVDIHRAATREYEARVLSFLESALRGRAV